MRALVKILFAKEATTPSTWVCSCGAVNAASNTSCWSCE